MEVSNATIQTLRNDVLTFDEKALLTYEAYRQMIDAGHLENKVTGNEQSDDLLHYSLLNVQRMNRWDKHYTPSELMQETIKSLPANWHVVVIAEGWCGDAAQIVPAIKKFTEFGNNWKFSIVLRDENPDWMNLFLTNNAKAIPIAVVFDEKGKYCFHWGPRPQEAIDLIANAKAANVPLDIWKVDLHKWYATNKQQALEKEWVSLLANWK